MSRAWQIKCCVCGEVSVETYHNYPFCEDCWSWFRTVQGMVDWKASTSFVVKFMQRKLEQAKWIGEAAR